MADSAINNIAAQSQAAYLKPSETNQQQPSQVSVSQQQSSQQASGQIGSNSGVAVVSALKAANDSFARIVMTGLISNPSGSVSEVDLSSFSNDPNINVDKETADAQLANSLDRAKEYEKRSDFSEKDKRLYDRQSESRNVVERNENSKKLQSAAQETSEYKKNIFLRASEGDDTIKNFSLKKDGSFNKISDSENSLRSSIFDTPSSSSSSTTSKASSSTTSLSVSVNEKNSHDRLGTGRVDAKQTTRGQIDSTEKERMLAKIQSEQSEHRAESDKAVSAVSKEKMHEESTSRIDVPAAFPANIEKQHRIEVERTNRKVKALEKLSPIERLRRRVYLRREISSQFQVKY